MIKHDLPHSGNEDWSTYRRLILSALDSIDERLSEVEDNAHDQDTDITMLKFKMGLIAGIVGFFSGLLPVLLQILFSYLSSKP